DVEAPECLPERVPLPEHDGPAQPDLEHAQGERLEHRGLVVGAGTPDLVVVAAQSCIARACPAAAWLPVVPDDHVAAHRNVSRSSIGRARIVIPSRETCPVEIVHARRATSARADIQSVWGWSRSPCTSSMPWTSSSTEPPLFATVVKSRRYR